jgi:hypothetical protein
MTAGIITAGAAGNWWAWAALRLVADPAAVSAQPTPEGLAHNEFSGTAGTVVQARDVHGGVHLYPAAEPAPDITPSVRALWQLGVTSGATIELRRLTEPAGRFLVVRVSAPEQLAAVDLAADLRARLSGAARPMRTEPVESADELRRALEPFTPDPRGLVEIHKRLTVARSTRGDAREPWLAAVTPLRPNPRSWSPLWTELARFPAVLSVGLLPVRVGPGFRAHLAAQATEMARLARPGQPATGNWSVPRPPDPFAVAADPLYAEAVRRYTDQAFTVRVSLAAPLPVSDALAELAAGTISPVAPDAGFAGAPPVIVRPLSDETAIAWRNIAACNADPLRAAEPAQPVGQLPRLLTTMADIEEAAAVFRVAVGA